MKRARARSCSSVYRRKKTIRNWDDTTKRAEQLLDELKSSDETIDESGTPVPKTREQRIQSAGKQIKTLGEVLELIEALAENLAAGDVLSLQAAEKSVERKKYQNSKSHNNDHKDKRETNKPRNLEVTLHTRCPICGKAEHEKTKTIELANV